MRHVLEFLYRRLGAACIRLGGHRVRFTAQRARRHLALIAVAVLEAAKFLTFLQLA